MAKLDLEGFLRGGRAAQQAVDDALALHGFATSRIGGRVVMLHASPRFRRVVRFIVEHPHVLGGDIPEFGPRVMRSAERLGLIEWDPMTLGFFATMKGRVYVGAGVL